MRQLVTATVRGIWTLGLLGCLAVGLQTFNSNPKTTKADDSPKTYKRTVTDPDNTVNDEPEAKPEKPSQKPPVIDNNRPVALMYGEHGFVPFEIKSPGERSVPSMPRRKFVYREPTATITPAQIAWARMLPNYNGLLRRGLSTEDMIRYFAPNEVKALEGEEVPEHLRPDTRPQAVYINERCKNGTCVTGYCDASHSNILCQGGVCRQRQK